MRSNQATPRPSARPADLLTTLLTRAVKRPQPSAVKRWLRQLQCGETTSSSTAARPAADEKGVAR